MKGPTRQGRLNIVIESDHTLDPLGKGKATAALRRSASDSLNYPGIKEEVAAETLPQVPIMSASAEW